MLERSRLLDRVGRSPLTVVRAPGGSGKTVLLAEWAARRPESGTWVTVERDAGSRVAFWGAVMDGLSLAGRAAPELGDDGDAREALRRTVIRALRAIDEPIVLVIDDAHEIADPVVFEDLLMVLRACRNVTAVVGTRSRSELETPGEALTLDRAVIQPDELAFTVAEIEAFAGEDAERFGSPDELLAASGGSPLLLRAILAGASNGLEGNVSSDSVVLDHVRRVFRAHADVEGFAATTAVPEDVDLETAAHVTGLSEERARRVLLTLENEGLVMQREVGAAVRYRYHPLVRELLREDLRRRHPDRFRSVSLVASADAEARRQYVSALRHAVEAEDYARASDVCLHGGFALIRTRGAAAVLQGVPLRHIARLPFLAIMLGLAANAGGERLRALEYLTLALGASRAGRRSQRPAERAGLALIESTVLRITGRADEALAATKRMLTVLEEAAPEDLEEIADQLGSYRYQGAASLFRAGHLAEARTVAEEVGISPKALALGASESLAAASLVALIDAAQGDMPSAADVLSRIDKAGFTELQLNGYQGALAHLARAIVALEHSDADAAEAIVEAFGERVNLEYGMLFTAFRAFLSLWREAPEVGLALLETREEADHRRARLSGADRRILGLLRVLLHASAGHVGPAHSELRAWGRDDPLAAVLRAALLLVEQKPEEALNVLSAHRGRRGARLEAASELLTAWAALDQGDEQLAAAALRRFLAVSEVHGVVSPMMLIPADERARLALLAHRVKADPDLIERLLALPSPLRSGVVRVALTPREEEVLEQLRETGSVSEIAATLSVSTNTVKSQVRTLYQKLGVTSRADALRAANLQGLLRD